MMNCQQCRNTIYRIKQLLNQWSGQETLNIVININITINDSFLGGFCPPPPDIANTIKISNGSNTGSLTVYICVSGFVENGEDPFISCNGTHWTNTLFACSGELKIELINDFENKGTMIPIAYLLNCYCQYAVISTEYIQYNMKSLYFHIGCVYFFK